MTNDPSLYQSLKFRADTVSLWNFSHELHADKSEIWRAIQDDTISRLIFLLSYDRDLPDRVEDLPNHVYCWDISMVPDHTRYRPNLHWFDVVSRLFRHLSVETKLIDPLSGCTPRYHWDCLLGRSKPQRDWLANKIHGSSYRDRFLLSYLGQGDKWLPGSEIDSGNLIEIYQGFRGFGPKEISPGDITDSEVCVQIQGDQRYCLSMLPSWQIFNQSWFSIVSETNAHHEEWTEKTAKALICKKFFVLVSAPGSLRSLRRAGFKTFDSVIDESYDFEPDLYRRLDKIWTQIEYVASQPPAVIYKLLLPILEHNQQLMLEKNWQDDMKKQMQQLIYAHNLT